MIKAAIDRILELGRIETHTIGGRLYTTKALHPVLDPEPEPLAIGTLTGLADYLRANPDGLVVAETVVHINGPGCVTVHSNLQDDFDQRMKYLVAKLERPSFPFGSFIGAEAFVIALLSQFIQNDHTAGLLKLVGNLTDGIVKTFEDDGTTQKVTAKVGVAKREDVVVPARVKLAPFRTFPEIDQPESEFLFRMRSGEKEPLCALIEADGGAWKMEAVKRVREWLSGKIPEGIVILS